MSASKFLSFASSLCLDITVSNLFLFRALRFRFPHRHTPAELDLLRALSPEMCFEKMREEHLAHDSRMKMFVEMTVQREMLLVSVRNSFYAKPSCPTEAT